MIPYIRMNVETASGGSMRPDSWRYIERDARHGGMAARQLAVGWRETPGMASVHWGMSIILDDTI